MSGAKKRPELRLVQPTRVDGLTPPHDLNAEAAVISSVLLKPSCFELVSPFLDVSSWYSDQNRLIWQAIERVRASGEVVDIVTVSRRMNEDGVLRAAGGTAYMAQVVDSTPAISHVVAHAHIVSALGRRRVMIATLQELASTGYREVESEAEWLARCEAEVARVRRERLVSDDVDITVARDSALAELDAQQALMMAGARPGLPTGLEDVDKLTGGLHFNETLMLSAPEKGFKTTFSLGLATTVARTTERHLVNDEAIDRPRGVLLCSLEQTREELARGIAYMLSGVKREKFTTGAADYDDFDKARRALRALDRMPIRFACQPKLTPSELRAKVIANRSYFASRGAALRLVVVDYLQLMSADVDRGDPDNRERELDSIGKSIREMSLDPELRGIAWVCLSQLNDQGKLRGSRALQQHCVSWWDLAVDKAQSKRDTYRPATMPTKLTIKLQRHGPAPVVVPLWCHSDVGTFTDGTA